MNEIREGLAQLIPLNIASSAPELHKRVYADRILQYLDENNVVLKVEGELPENPYEPSDLTCEDGIPYNRAQQDMLDAGYSLTESLI